jgi:hypothetical protein
VLGAIHARSDAPRIATFNRLEPSWVFYSGRTLEDYKSARDAATFLASGPDAFIITSGDRLPWLRPSLPEDVDVVAQVPYFGRSEPIYVIGHRAPGGSPTFASSGTRVQEVHDKPKGS